MYFGLLHSTSIKTQLDEFTSKDVTAVSVPINNEDIKTTIYHTHIHTHTHTHTHTRTHAHTRTHTHMHTNTHIHT